jgi:RNase P subunit RPR2
MKILLSILALFSVLLASTDVADSAACKKCHPIITEEFEPSMHKKASIYDDKIHKAIWDLHPAKAKGNYKCAKCHTPNAVTKKEQHTGVTCISCHTIINVEKHAKANKNIYTAEPKTFYSAQVGHENEKVVYKQTSSFFGLNKTTVGSAYHDIDYTNELYYNGKLCMGCHSHKQNAYQFDVCRTDEKGAKNKKENCITCHMPKVDGTATTVRLSKQHAYHGFTGAHANPKMLAKYVILDFKKLATGFEVSVNNTAPHNLMTHPLRVVQLKTTLIRDAKERKLKTHTFVKVIGTDGKPSFPWLATEVVKDNMIKADEKRVVNFDEILQSGDKLEVVIGYYLVNPKVLKKLNLEDDKEISKFTILKSQYFTVE